MRQLVSRIDKEPPASFYANLLAYLAQSFPTAALDEDVLLELKPLWDTLWRAGRNAETAAQTTCSCDGKRIFPSQTTSVHYVRGVARPPTKAQRGRIYPLSDLRETSEIERAKKKFQLASDRVSRIQARVTAFVAEYNNKPPVTEAQAERKRATISRLQAELNDAIAETKRLRNDVTETRFNYPYSELRKHLPALSVSEPGEEIKVVAHPKPKKEKKSAHEKPKGDSGSKSEKRVISMTVGDKPTEKQKPKSKSKAAEKDQILLNAIGDKLKEAVASLMKKP